MTWTLECALLLQKNTEHSITFDPTSDPAVFYLQNKMCACKKKLLEAEKVC